MIDRINAATEGETIPLIDCPYFISVEFFYRTNDGYSWRASDGIRPTYPIEAYNNIKFFKTLTGAKRNFIKRLR